MFAGGSGSPRTNVIQYITIASTGNATDFGDLTEGKGTSMQSNNSIKHFVAGGNTPSLTDKIEKITIATTGNATDMADLTASRGYGAGSSTSAGGLQ